MAFLERIAGKKRKEYGKPKILNGAVPAEIFTLGAIETNQRGSFFGIHSALLRTMPVYDTPLWEKKAKADRPA